MGTLDLRESDNGVWLTIKAVPGASRDCIVGPLGGMLKIAVAAAPQRGEANRAIIELLAHRLGIHPRQIALTRGQTSPRKEVFITGMNAAQVRALLFPPAA